MRRIRLVVIALLCFLFTTCAKPVDIRIALAANLLPAFEKIQEEFEKDSGQKIALSTASSGALYAQIQHGAPFDLFISANEIYPQKLHADGIGKQSPQILAYGQLMFWASKPINTDSLAAHLMSEETHRIAIPDPELAPYGAAAQTWLQSQGLWEGIKAQLIIGNNVSHTNQVIRSGSVDIAFTSASAMYWANLDQVGNWYYLKGAGAISQTYLVLKNHVKIQSFLRYLKSEKVAEILSESGFLMKLDREI